MTTTVRSAGRENTNYSRAGRAVTCAQQTTTVPWVSTSCSDSLGLTNTAVQGQAKHTSVSTVFFWACFLEGRQSPDRGRRLEVRYDQSGFVLPAELPGLTGPSAGGQGTMSPWTRGADACMCCVTTPSALQPTPSNTTGAEFSDSRFISRLFCFCFSMLKCHLPSHTPPSAAFPACRCQVSCFFSWAEPRCEPGQVPSRCLLPCGQRRAGVLHGGLPLQGQGLLPADSPHGRSPGRLLSR